MEGVEWRTLNGYKLEQAFSNDVHTILFNMITMERLSLQPLEVLLMSTLPELDAPAVPSGNTRHAEFF